MQPITNPRYREMLEDMTDPVGQYDEGNRSQMAQSVIAHMLNGGMAHDTIEMHLLDSRNALSSWARVHKRSGRMRSEADALKHIRDSIHKSVANPKGPNYKPAVASPGEANQVIGEWKMLLEDCVWGGRRTSLLSILSYVGVIATKTGSVVITVSTRQLAEECGIGQKTAARGIEKALEEGWLRRTERPARQDGEPHLLAPAYRISTPLQVVLNSHARSDSVATVVPGVRATESLCVDQDAFAWMGLGKSAARVYGLLKQQGLTYDQLAELTGFHRDTIKRALTRLLDNQLVVDLAGLVDLIIDGAVEEPTELTPGVWGWWAS